MMPTLHKQARFLVLVAISLLVLVIVPVFNDSTNIPKFSVLIFISAFGIGILSIPKFGLLEKANWLTWAPPLFFLTVMLLLVLINDQKYTAFFGAYGRNNGWFLYLSLTVLFLLTAFSFNFATLKKLFNILITLGLIVTGYGYLQYNDIDFINYITPGNPIIATLGNPNFASALMGFSAIALVWKITEVKKLWQRSIFLLTLLFQGFIIYSSESSQGLFILLIGSVTLIGIKFFTSNKKSAITYFSLFGLASFTGLLGLFQVGPLSRIVYQDSTTYRGDYFRAAWRMFESHPLMGVGIERFGEYYRMYRDVDAAMRLGPRFVTNYVHNVPLQLLSTGGIFLLLAYIAMIIVVAYAAFKGLMKFKGGEKSLFGALISLWLAFQIQTQISVDQVAVAALGWVLAGAIVAIGLNSELIVNKAFRPNTYAHKKRSSNSNTTLVAGGLSLVLLVVSSVSLVPIWKADYTIKQARLLQGDRNDFNFLALKRDLALKAVESAPREVRYKLLASVVLSGAKELELARQQLRDVLELDPRSYEAVIMTAKVYEIAGLTEEAIKTRVTATKMDPNDTDNWLQLGKNFAQLADFEAIKKAIKLVEPLKDKSTIADDLRKLIPVVPTS
jgi:putative inorganic carbon (HCO3(-)) transporter